MMSQISCLLYICLQGLFKDLQLTFGMSIVEITFLRTATTLVGACILIAIFKKNPFTEVDRGDLVPLLFRSLASSCASIIVPKAVLYLPITIFQTMVNLTPFISGILACIFLGEKLALVQILCMTLCFGGIVIVAFGGDVDEAEISSETDVQLTFDDYQKGLLLSCACIMLFSTSAVLTRRVREVHFSVVQFYLALVGLVVASIWLLIELDSEKDFFQYSGARPWLEVFGGSLCFYLAQIITTCTHQSLNPATVGMFMYTLIFYAYIADVVAFDQHLNGL